MSTYGIEVEEDQARGWTPPLSFRQYLHLLLRRNFWGDEVVLFVVSCMWSVKITVLNTKTMQEYRIRHDRAMEDADMVVTYNGSNHFNAASKKDPTPIWHWGWTKCRPLQWGRGWGYGGDTRSGQKRSRQACSSWAPTCSGSSTAPSHCWWGGREEEGTEKDETTSFSPSSGWRPARRGSSQGDCWSPLWMFHLSPGAKHHAQCASRSSRLTTGLKFIWVSTRVRNSHVVSVGRCLPRGDTGLNTPSLVFMVRGLHALCAGNCLLVLRPCTTIIKLNMELTL